MEGGQGGGVGVRSLSQDGLLRDHEGGLPVRMNGELVGAMAASGARGSEDAQVVRAGLAAMGADPVR